MDYAIAGIPLAAVIVAVVQMAKELGLPSRWAAPLAVVLGLLLGAAGAAGAGNPEAERWLAALLGGIVVGLAAAGLYSGTKAVRGG